MVPAATTPDDVSFRPPPGKIVAKIDLADMTPPTEDVTPVYPDPLLLAYKSSINWTRLLGFQLMAEAEPQDLRFFPFGDVADQGSKVSSLNDAFSGNFS